MATSLDQRPRIPLRRAEHYVREWEPMEAPAWGITVLPVAQLVVELDRDPTQVTLAALPDPDDDENLGYRLDFDLDPDGARVVADLLLQAATLAEAARAEDSAELRPPV